MAECMVCTCKAIVAMDRIMNVARYIGYYTEELPENLHEVEKAQLDFQARNALHALSEVEEVCHLKMDDVKAYVNLANFAFKNQKFFPAYDHILDAKAKFETKMCKTGV